MEIEHDLESEIITVDGREYPADSFRGLGDALRAIRRKAKVSGMMDLSKVPETFHSRETWPAGFE